MLYAVCLTGCLEGKIGKRERMNERKRKPNIKCNEYMCNEAQQMEPTVDGSWIKPLKKVMRYMTGV